MARSQENETDRGHGEKHEREDYFEKIRGTRIPGAQGLRDPGGYYGSRQADDPAVRIAEQHFKLPYGHYNPERRYLRGDSPDWPVSGGDFTGKGPRGYTRSDERITDDVCYGLIEHPGIDADRMEVEVRGGIVTLTGTADSRRMKRLAEDVALAVPGVADVQNRLRIRRDPLGAR